MISRPNIVIKSFDAKNNQIFSAFFYSKTIIICDSNLNIMVNSPAISQ